MPTFTDESGDGGVGPGTPDRFRFTAVWFETAVLSAAFEAAVADLKKNTLRVKERFEFKSSHTKCALQEAFLREAARHPFRFASCVAVKGRFPGPGRLSKARVFVAAIRPVAAALGELYRPAEARKGSPLNERVVFDRHTDPDYLACIRDEFLAVRSEARPGAALVKSVKPADSEGRHAVQLADLVSGAAGRAAEGDDRLFRLIADKGVVLSAWG